MKEPQVRVGILSAKEIRFILHGDYMNEGEHISGMQRVRFSSGKIEWNGNSYKELLFSPMYPESVYFELHNVVIGIGFHWERNENQSFQGALKVIVEDEKLLAVNIIPMEVYLVSVISSEMSATSSLELLKAHAVISRSWLLNILKPIHGKSKEKKVIKENKSDESQLIKWYDHEEHINFDVCADDHCQRYQGITRASAEIVKKAVSETNGEVLMSEGKICDARFSKCCGGAFEEFQYCWEDLKHPYLVKQRDSNNSLSLPDLRDEREAEHWIRSEPEAFCNTQNKDVLKQILNNYDQETPDFYRWKVIYTQKELSDLVKLRSGIDYGEIQELIPVERGTSGRLVKLKIVGSKRTLIIGKELEIRRTLSSSHLYSSAFVVDKVGDKFILTGAGWGHGVGLCQIGAAIMGSKGYKYDEILSHYYRGTEIVKLY